jgi:hypothetical protein
VLLQWVVAAVDYNATKEMFQAFDNFRLLYALSTLGVTAATYGAGAIVESACTKTLRFSVQSVGSNIEKGVPQVCMQYCNAFVAASFTALLDYAGSRLDLQLLECIPDNLFLSM